MERDAQLCARRIARLRDIMDERGYDALVLRNLANLRWLTGCATTFDDEVAHTAFITSDSLWLHTDSRYFGTFQNRFGSDDSWTVDMEPIDHPAWVASLIGSTRSRVVAVESTFELGFYDDLNKAVADKGLAALFPRLHDEILYLRQVKDASEIELMRAAQAITDDAFDHMCSWMHTGITEKQVRAELEGYMLSHGADALSFDSIIASGPNGANPHAQPGDRVLAEGDLVVMDYGAGLGDYHSDMTRTVCMGTPSAEQQAVYDVVRLAHETCAAAVHAGVIGRDIHELAVKVIADAGYGDYFAHGLGHGVGVQIHERPNFGRSYELEVPCGSVVTIEPGIYLPGRFGIRLEDFGLVTEDGYEPFTTSTHDLVTVSN